LDGAYFFVLTVGGQSGASFEPRGHPLNHFDFDFVLIIANFIGCWPIRRGL